MHLSVSAQAYMLAAASCKHIQYGVLLSHLTVVLRVADDLRAKNKPQWVAIVYDRIVREGWERDSQRFRNWRIEDQCGVIDTDALSRACAEHDTQACHACARRVVEPLPVIRRRLPQPQKLPLPIARSRRMTAVIGRVPGRRQIGTRTAGTPTPKGGSPATAESEPGVD